MVMCTMQDDGSRGRGVIFGEKVNVAWAINSPRALTKALGNQVLWCLSQIPLAYQLQKFINDQDTTQITNVASDDDSPQRKRCPRRGASGAPLCLQQGCPLTPTLEAHHLPFCSVRDSN